MNASALPAAGAPEPAGERKTCDASGMAEIHRYFRAGFGEGPMLVRGVAPGDTAHARVVAEELETLSAGLHAHHDGEDARLWGPVADRSPACAMHVARMKEQHTNMLARLGDLDAALPAWRRGATEPELVIAALDEINETLRIHLPDEEATIVPVMETTLTRREVEWFSKHGRKATPKGQTWNQLGAILAAQPDGGDDWMRKRLPGPARFAWRMVGRKKYAVHRAALVKP